ncbi:hypothetical protein CDAR_312661 [Caerostris darwini]|uniref:Uncharacterized protein n=1 Tax=Caerostris darwini TaxID=1538125 RepID=A0AAV4MCX0_9ARAC|nr:hypothetical protein CDAR_312661 [Caerostris darwini]
MSCETSDDELFEVKVEVEEPCEELPQANNELLDLALKHYQSIVNMTDKKELKRDAKRAFRKKAMSLLTTITTQSNRIAQLEDRITELEKTIANKPNTGQLTSSQMVQSNPKPKVQHLAVIRPIEENNDSKSTRAFIQKNLDITKAKIGVKKGLSYQEWRHPHRDNGGRGAQ